MCDAIATARSLSVDMLRGCMKYQRSIRQPVAICLGRRGQSARHQLFFRVAARALTQAATVAALLILVLNLPACRLPRFSKKRARVFTRCLRILTDPKTGICTTRWFAMCSLSAEMRRTTWYYPPRSAGCVWSSCIVFSALISIKYYFVLLSPPRLLRRKWKLLFSSHLPTFILDLPIHEWYALHSQSVDFITDLTVLGLSRLGAPPVCVWLSEPRAQCSVPARSDGS